MQPIISKRSPLFFSILLSAILIPLFFFTFAKRTQFDTTPNPSSDPAWPSEVVKIEYPSSADDTLQPALFYAPAGNEPVPLLIALHSWSGDYIQGLNAPAAEWCIEHGWAFLHPNFRGPNKRPEATGSEFVIEDILSAVDFATTHLNIDRNRIYLVGASGGGYTALLVMAQHPDIWAGVSIWVPISDLSIWHEQTKYLNPDFTMNLETSLGGAPGTSPEVDLEYIKRSPLTYLSTDITTPLDINAGIHDGHNGSVPINQSLWAFNALVDSQDRLSEQEITYFVEQEKVPADLIDPLLSDPAYGEEEPLFRRQSQNTRLTIFDGGHQIIFEAALSWLAQQQK